MAWGAREWVWTHLGVGAYVWKRVGLGSSSGHREAYGSEGIACHSVGFTCPHNRLPLSELRGLGRKMSSPCSEPQQSRQAKSLHPERLSDKERAPTDDLEDQKGSPEEKTLYSDSSWAFTFLITVFRTQALRSSLWWKLSLKVVPGRCVYTLSLMYVSAEYNKKSLWSSPNLLNLIAFQQILSSIKFSYWVTNMWGTGRVTAVYMRCGCCCCLAGRHT